MKPRNRNILWSIPYSELSFDIRLKYFRPGVLTFNHFEVFQRSNDLSVLLHEFHFMTKTSNGLEPGAFLGDYTVIKSFEVSPIAEQSTPTLVDPSSKC